MLNVSAVSTGATNNYHKKTQVPTVDRSDTDLLEQKKPDSVLSAKELHGLMSNSRVSAITKTNETISQEVKPPLSVLDFSREEIIKKRNELKAEFELQDFSGMTDCDIFNTLESRLSEVLEKISVAHRNDKAP